MRIRFLMGRRTRVYKNSFSQLFQTVRNTFEPRPNIHNFNIYIQV